MPDNKADLSSPTGSASPGSGLGARRVVERLDEPECMELLSTAKIGRLVYNSRYGPVAVPSEYKIYEGSVVFRTYRATFTEEDLRTGIAHAEYQVVVEVDHVDQEAREVRGEDQPGMGTVAPLGHEHPALNQDLGRDLQVFMLTPEALDRGR